MKSCLCCNESLVRQVHRRKFEWYCSRCRQYMPLTEDLGNQGFRLKRDGKL